MGGTYRDLRAWQNAMDLALKIYQATTKFPRDEMYGLTSQLRRAAVSVPSNIAEGKGRSSDKELLQFLSRARGSVYELQTQLEVAKSLCYLSSVDHLAIGEQANDVGRMLNGMIAKIRQAVSDSAA
jgi:four helix bundle protein